MKRCSKPIKKQIIKRKEITTVFEKFHGNDRACGWSEYHKGIITLRSNPPCLNVPGHDVEAALLGVWKHEDVHTACCTMKACALCDAIDDPLVRYVLVDYGIGCRCPARTLKDKVMDMLWHPMLKIMRHIAYMRLNSVQLR